jgi:PAS domain S-box-containing protein
MERRSPVAEGLDPAMTDDARTSQQAALAELGRRALAGAGIFELCDSTVRLLAENLGVEHAGVLELAPDRDCLIVTAGVGWQEGVIGMRVGVGTKSQSGYTLQSRAPVITEDLPNETRFVPQPTLLESGIKSGVTVIIPGRERPYGVLAAHSTSLREFTHDDVLFFTAMASTLGSMIEYVRAQERLGETEVKYRNLVEQVPAVVYIDAVDDISTVLYISPQVYELTGYTQAEHLAHPELWVQRLHRDDRDRVLAESNRTNETGDPWHMEYRMIHPDGRIVWVRDDAVLLRDDHGRPLYWQGILLDVTEEKMAEEALRRAYEREHEAAEELRSVNEMKNAFLAAVSHEVRTPLSSVLGYAMTLERPDISLPEEEQKELTHRLAVNARKLERLLADLLDLDRLSRGVLEPRRRLTNMPQLTNRVIEETDLRGHPVILDVEPLMVHVDAPKVERVVENLLVNAVKHTEPEDRVWLRVARRHEGVLIAVEDEGPGVPDELKAEVFEPFRQGGNGGSHVSGTGIGLSLVARFAELHGGHAWVEDRTGGGARFNVYIPGVVQALPEG